MLTVVVVVVMIPVVIPCEIPRARVPVLPSATRRNEGAWRVWDWRHSRHCGRHLRCRRGSGCVLVSLGLPAVLPPNPT
jgi:hypothetical protein